jgi:hypothetical protein
MGETLHRTLVAIGLAQDEEHEPLEATDDMLALVESLERQVTQNTEEIEALRAELDELRARP